jgi:hypothetical protein
MVIAPIIVYTYHTSPIIARHNPLKTLKIERVVSPSRNRWAIRIWSIWALWAYMAFVDEHVICSIKSFENQLPRNFCCGDCWAHFDASGISCGLSLLCVYLFFGTLSNHVSKPTQMSIKFRRTKGLELYIVVLEQFICLLQNDSLNHGLSKNFRPPIIGEIAL